MSVAGTAITPLLSYGTTGADIHALLALTAGDLAITTASWIQPKLMLSNMNAAAATITVKICQITDDPDTTVYRESIAKDNAADTSMTIILPPFFTTANKTYSIKVLSSNASDTNVTWNIDWCDVGITAANLTQWLGTAPQAIGAAGGLPVLDASANLLAYLRGFSPNGVDTAIAAEGAAGRMAANWLTFFNAATQNLTGACVNQTGDSYAKVTDANYGLAKLVRSTTPGNTLTIDASHRAYADVEAVGANAEAATRLKFFMNCLPCFVVDSFDYETYAGVSDVQAATGCTALLASSDAYTGSYILFRSGVGAHITSDTYAGGYHTFTFYPPLTVSVNYDTGIIIPARLFPAAAAAGIGAAVDASATGVKTSQVQILSGKVLSTGNQTHMIGEGDGFLFTLSAASATGKVLSDGGTTYEDVDQYDGYWRNTTHSDATVGTQWQLTTTVLQDDPFGSNPTIAFSSTDESVATVNSDGLATFVGDGSCELLASSQATDDSPARCERVTITNSTTGGETLITSEFIPEALDVSKHLLIVYNADSTDSVSLKDYYLSQRPGISTANLLGLSGLADTEQITNASYTTLIQTPVVAELQTLASADKYIRNIVLLQGVPTRTSDYAKSSVSFLLSTSLLTLDIRTGKAFDGAAGQFSIGKYPGTTALVTHIHCGTYAASRAYIDKLAWMAARSGALQVDGVTISGSASGYGADRWVLDNANTYAFDLTTDRYNVLIAAGVSASDITHQSAYAGPRVATAADVTFLLNWGVHSPLSNGWPLTSMPLTGDSRWFALQTIESFNGQMVSSQGDVTEFYSATAFGGTNYSNTPVLFVGHTEEPSTWGINYLSFGQLWYLGWTGAEAAWQSRATPHFICICDPYITR